MNHLIGFTTYNYNEAKEQSNVLFFVHGLGCTHAIWQPLIDQLPRHFPIMAIDLPGHGSTQIPLSNTINDLCIAILNFLNEQEIHSISFIGHSLGGLVGLQFSLLFPEKIRHLIVINSHYKIDLLPDFVEAVLKGEIQDEMVKKSIGSKASAKLHQWILNRITPIKINQGADDILDLSSFHLGNRVYQIKQPTFIIAGNEDPLISPRKSTTLCNKIPNAKFLLLDKTGHYAHVEEYVRIANEIKQFLLQY